jgi:peptidoglycan/xylan/chitin deacetylase (PgdA/CDA1 family)
MATDPISRRSFLAGAAGMAGGAVLRAEPTREHRQARIAVTLDLEMSRDYPQRGITEWDYQKGNLDEATKAYAVEAGRRVKAHGGRIHFFCVGRVLEQPDVAWLKQLADDGHPIGNHTYDHVNVLATTAAETQFRFQRAPWLVAGKTAAEVTRENIRLTTEALRERAGIENAGFRTPGGFANGLTGRPDIQQMLLDVGFTWVSSKYPPHERGVAGERPTAAVFDSIVAAQAQSQPLVYPSGLIEIPMSPISDVTAFRSQRWKLNDFLTALRRAVEWTIETGGVFDFLGHPSCLVVEDPGFESIELLCRLARDSGGRAELTDLSAIAASAGKVATQR